MYSNASRAINTYTKVGVETGVAAADPHRLILMLFDGALAAITQANAAIVRKDISAKGAAISKAIAIVDGGLKASLDVKAGGLLAERLSGLYDYMLERLLIANLRSDPEILNEVSRLLNELRGAWAQIGQQGVNTGAAGSTAK